MTTRRAVITLLGATAASWPVGAWGQQSTVPVIGWLGSTALQPSHVIPFVEGLKVEGFTENKNVVVHYRWAEGAYERLPAFVDEFVGNKVDLIAAHTTVAALAAKRVPPTIPVVFLIGGDAVGLGLVDSINRPGGNRTGVSLITHSLDAKRLEVLRELVPGLKRIGVILNPKSATSETNKHDVLAAAQSLGLETTIVYVAGENDLTSAFTHLSVSRADALLVGADSLLHSINRAIVQLAAQHRLPAAHEWRENVQIGGLLSYGTDLAAVVQQMGRYGARILKGSKPADLPVLEPSKFELAINLKTARALGITVPATLLARADEVIE
jgi:putative ABC transport system substrate-binding protein